MGKNGSDESSIPPFTTTGWAYVWKKRKDAFKAQCGGSVMLFTVISWDYLGLKITLRGRIMAKEYEAALQDKVHPAAQTLFPNDFPIFEDNTHIHTAKQIQGLFHEHQGEVKWIPRSPQSPDLNSKTLWEVLELRVQSRFPAPSSLQTALLEKMATACSSGLYCRKDWSCFESKVWSHSLLGP